MTKDMKATTLIPALLAAALALTACYDDKGHYDYTTLPEATVSGIADTYTCNLLETLEIDPQLTASEPSSEYDCMWMCYDKKDFKKKIDTLSVERHLNYKVTLPLSTYQLIFACKNRSTGITKYTYATLTVQSAGSRGWYVLKEASGNTELDFFIGEKATPNILALTQGSPLLGRPRYLGFLNYAWLDEASGKLSKGNQSFMVMTEQDARIFRIADMKEMADFKDIFFEDAPDCKPGFWFGGSEENGMMNNGKLYAYTERNGQLGASKFAFPKDGDYELSPVFTKNATMSPLLFDMKHGKFCTSYTSPDNIVTLEDDAASQIKNDFAGYEPVYFGFLYEDMWTGGKMYAVMKNQQTGILRIVYIDSNNLVYFDDAFMKNRITRIQDVPSDAAFAKASCFAQSRKFEMMYFAVNDKLYSYDLINNAEREVTRQSGVSAVPQGEQIVMMKHIVFDYADWQDPNIKEYVERLAVATVSGTTYKLYLFEPQAGQVKDAPIVYQGSGRPVQVFYMSPYMGNTDVCY